MTQSFSVVHPRLQVGDPGDPVRQAGPALVEEDQAAERGHLLVEPCGRALPSDLEVVRIHPLTKTTSNGPSPIVV
jgi:hypothetical protein